MPEPIDDPLWDLMLSTHGCTPSCGCNADFHIDPRAIGGWIDDFGEDFTRFALRQVDGLLVHGRAIEEAVGVQRNQPFRPHETVTAWLLHWRLAIEQALRDFLAEDVPPVAEAEATRAAARDALFAARRRWTEREQRAIEAAKQDPNWGAAEQVQRRAMRRLLRIKAEDAKAKPRAALSSARAVMDPVEEACRAQDPDHAASAQALWAAQSALLEAERRLRRAIARTNGVSDGRSMPYH